MRKPEPAPMGKTLTYYVIDVAHHAESALKRRTPSKERWLTGEVRLRQ